jgi:hypothetical protein
MTKNLLIILVANKYFNGICIRAEQNGWGIKFHRKGLIYLVIRLVDILTPVNPLPFTDIRLFLLQLHSECSVLYETYLWNVNYLKCVQIGRIGVASLTNVTFKWLLSCVSPLIYFQGTFGIECHFTIWSIANILRNAFVPAHVTSQTFSTWKYFPAAWLTAHNFLQRNSTCIYIRRKDNCVRLCDVTIFETGTK